jgi:hypothetical protein
MFTHLNRLIPKLQELRRTALGEDPIAEDAPEPLSADPTTLDAGDLCISLDETEDLFLMNCARSLITCNLHSQQGLIGFQRLEEVGEVISFQLIVRYIQRRQTTILLEGVGNRENTPRHRVPAQVQYLQLRVHAESLPYGACALRTQRCVGQVQLSHGRLDKRTADPPTSLWSEWVAADVKVRHPAHAKQSRQPFSVGELRSCEPETFQMFVVTERNAERDQCGGSSREVDVEKWIIGQIQRD